MSLYLVEVEDYGHAYNKIQGDMRVANKCGHTTLIAGPRGHVT